MEAGRAACFASSATAEACGAEPVEGGTVGEQLEGCLAEPALVDASAGCRIEPGSEDAVNAQLRAFFASACVLGGDISDR